MCRVRRKNSLSPELTGYHIHFPIHTGLNPGSPLTETICQNIITIVPGMITSRLKNAPCRPGLFARLTGCEFSRINE